MKVPYVEGVASHNGPESCGGDREVTAEALTGESAGQVLSRENRSTPGRRRVLSRRKATRCILPSPELHRPRVVGDPAHARKLSAREGGSISPLLANIYLHYVFDLWANKWRKEQAFGDVVIVRFCDDFVVGFQHRQEAERFYSELVERFRAFGLELHSGKTRILEFGRFAAENRRRRGKSKPETFDFLGFTHICGRTRKGKFTVFRHTMSKRILAKLRFLKEELRRRLHGPVAEVGKWLRTVLLGHFRYYGLPGNSRKLESFRYHVSCLWLKTLCRRSQRHKMNWDRMRCLIARWLPSPRIYRPYPDLSLYVTTRGRSPVR